jgi:M6 family metalloprotease-like protein
MVLLVLSVASGRTVLAQQEARPSLQPATAPGERSPGLQYFRLEPGVQDTVYRLLVIPVRFPDDETLGEDRGALIESLNGGGVSSLQGYYLAATGGRLRVESTLAPTVVAENSRSYYTTVEGEGNFGHGGLDPNAYPHNARRLVEEVTAKVVFDADFNHFDNTRDGITDGLLVIHSGPRAPEVPGDSIPLDYLLPHSFTLEVPVERGSAWVFPYSIAATRDPVGPWAHEVGHLFGLPDLYVANGFCPGPGIGEWSLMATGANRNGGDDPSGLDPFSRQLLGIEPVFTLNAPVNLEDGTYLRVYRPGEERGPRYFLVERRTGDDGLGLTQESSVVYYVDEDTGDNRSCTGPRLVDVRDVVCRGSGACSVRLDDFTDPNLQDGDGVPTHVVLDFTTGTVVARHEALPMMRLERIRLLEPTTPPGQQEEQRIEVTVRNLDRVTSRSADLDVSLLGSGDVCPVLTGSVWRNVLSPGEVLTDTSWALVACAPVTPLPEGSSLYTFALRETGTGFSRTDTVSLVANRVGLSDSLLASFTPSNLNPPRAEPWEWNPNTGMWGADSLDRFADGELLSPWFSVPAQARLLLDHVWDLTSLSPDVALDGGQVHLRRLLTSDAVVTPPLGWGHTAERKTGNALGGQEVLAGTGSRPHVLDLSGLEGEVVRIVLRVAGDVELGGGPWNVSRITVQPAPSVGFILTQDPFDDRNLLAETASPFEPAVELRLYEGPPATTPVDILGNQVWDGAGATLLGRAAGVEGRFELLWITESGEVDAYPAIFSFSSPTPSSGFLKNPHPNPVRQGETQDWTFLHADDAVPGFYEIRLLNVEGRLVYSLDVRVDATGERTVRWEGRDGTGREVPAGVYFLQVCRPDGRTDARKVVVVP